MNPKQLSDRIENIDDRLVQQAQQIPNYAQQHRKKRLRSWTAVAACIALMACSFLRGRVRLCKGDRGRGPHRAGDTGN